jgi:3-(methylthio)propanoyl-CoA dehydrogenase
MSSKSNFLYSTREHQFILKEWLDVGHIMSLPKFRDYYSLDDIDTILEQALKVAREVVAPSCDDAEGVGVKFEGGKVTVPQSFKDAYHFLQENGWGNHDPEEPGVLPHIVQAAYREYFTGANNTIGLLTEGAAKLIATYGRPEDKARFLPQMYKGKWGGTMCLTETGAGTDVGASVTKAFPTETPQVYRIKGTKNFITGGDHDYTENNIHLLLARVEGGAPGTRGLSLFIVPKIWVKEDGTLGAPNDVITLNIEHKMGIKGSVTAMLGFGESDNCLGILLGNPPNEKGVAEGIAQMFQMMNSARHTVGQIGLVLSTVAYNNAVQYAKERIQGKAMTNPRGPDVPIIKHEDVRRMLLDQKATIDAMRALIFKNWYYIDLAANSDDPEERQMASRHIQVLNPLGKAYCSDMAWILIAEAIQVYGGYGFCEEYPVEKLARDSKINSIWEGTNYVQSIDLVGRKWSLEGGALFNDWLAEVGQFIEGHMSAAGLEAEFALLQKAYDAYRQIYTTVMGFTKSNPSLVATFATRVLHATAMLYCGCLVAEQAMLALRRMGELGQGHYDYTFYQGKVMSARYYIRNVVPFVGVMAEIIKSGDTSVLDIPEECF